MARPKGIPSHIETKNKIVVLRVTAREQAKINLLASATNHHPSEITRKFIEDGLNNKKEDIQKLKRVNCITSNYLPKPYKSYNNNNNNKLSLSPPDNLSYKESINSDIPFGESENGAGVNAEEIPGNISVLSSPPFRELAQKDSERYIAKLEEYILRSDADVLIRELYKLEIKDLEAKKRE